MQQVPGYGLPDKVRMLDWTGSDQNPVEHLHPPGAAHHNPIITGDRRGLRPKIRREGAIDVLAQNTESQHQVGDISIEIVACALNRAGCPSHARTPTHVPAWD